MKRVLSFILAALLLLSISAEALADGSFRYEDGWLVGSVSGSGSNPEIWVNGSLAGGSSLKVRVGDGSYDIVAYRDGKVIETQTVSVDTGSTERIVSIAFTDSSHAVVTGDYEGLYVRIALVLENNGESGLYIAPGSIGKNGVIDIPVFDVPGLTVVQTCVALVENLSDVTARHMNPVAFVYI